MAVYQVTATNTYLKFNTTSSPGNPTNALLRIYLAYGGGRAAVVGDDIHLYTYVFDWGDDVDESDADWSGGVLADSTTIINSDDADSWVEIPLNSDEINIGGWSKYRLTLKETVDNVYPGAMRKSINITAAQLKINYD